MKTVKSEVIHVRIDPETMRELKQIAEDNERTTSWQALKFIKDGIKNAQGKT